MASRARAGREFGGEEESVLPIGRHIDEALVDKLRRVEGGVEILEPPMRRGASIPNPA